MNLKKTLFEKESILLTLALFQKRASFKIDDIGDSVNVEFVTQEPADALEREFREELVNQQVRRDLNVQFGNLRDMIVQQAFSPIAAKKG